MTSSADIPELIKRFAAGEILLLPTDTLYGLHARFDRPVSIETLRRLKGIPAGKPMIHLVTLDQAGLLGLHLSSGLDLLLREIWPAPVTFILPVAGRPGETLAVRWPDHPLWRALFDAGLPPVVSTSANRSSEPPCLSPGDLPGDMRGEVDYILHGKPALSARPSTLVDLSISPPRILREGCFVFPQNLWKKLWKTV